MRTGQAVEIMKDNTLLLIDVFVVALTVPGQLRVRANPDQRIILQSSRSRNYFNEK